MELLTGFPLLLQQFKALFMKNLLLSLRNKRSIILRILSPIFFLSLLLLAQNGMDSKERSNPLAKDIKDPETIIAPPIPPCEEKFFLNLPCFDFVWSGNDSTKIQSIVSKIMENNPGRPIPSTRVKSFRSPNEVDEWLFSDPMRCAGARHFVERDATVISYGIQINSTDRKKRGREEDHTFKFQIPLQVAAEREIARFFLGDSNFNWVVGLTGFPRPPSVSKQGPKINALEILGISLFLAIAMFSFIFQISSLVLEKELKLRQAMNVMGLYDTAYWLSWMTWEGIILILSSLVIVLFGMVIQFDFFLRNSFAVLFLVFYLFQFSMMGIAFVLSAMLSKSSSSTTVWFSFFLVFSASSNIAKFIGFSSIPKKYRIIYAIFPPHLFSEAVNMLTVATSSPTSQGISWSKRTECLDSSSPCEITINKIFIWQLSTFFFWFVLAIYFDNIIPNPAGVRKSLFYFLNPQYWLGNDGKKMEEGCFALSIPLLDHITSDDVDVCEEEHAVKQQAKEGLVDPSVAVQIRGLIKTYPATLECGCV